MRSLLSSRSSSSWKSLAGMLFLVPFVTRVVSMHLPAGQPASAQREKRGECSHCLDLAAYQLTATIPYTLDSFGYYTVNLQLDPDDSGTTVPATLDTSFTGVLVDGSVYNIYADSTPPTGAVFGSVYWPTLQTLFIGYWIEADLSFPDATQTVDGISAGAVIKFNTKVLAITEYVICPTYNLTVGGNTCPDSNATTQTDTAGLNLVGIGFGVAMGPDPVVDPLVRNPLLNINDVGGTTPQYPSNQTTASPSNMRKGYIITKDEIIVGLTEDNSKSVLLQKLKPWSSLEGDWSMPEGCVSVNGSECVRSSLLPVLDINPSLLFSDLKFNNLVRTQNGYDELPIASTVEFVFDGIGNYSHTTGTEGPELPTPVNVFDQVDRGYFVDPTKGPKNLFTFGDGWLQRFNPVYDAVGGYWGISDLSKNIGVFNGKARRDGIVGASEVVRVCKGTNRDAEIHE